jgi:hypothetical protein
MPSGQWNFLESLKSQLARPADFSSVRLNRGASALDFIVRAGDGGVFLGRGVMGIFIPGE